MLLGDFYSEEILRNTSQHDILAESRKVCECYVRSVVLVGKVGTVRGEAGRCYFREGALGQRVHGGWAKAA